MELLRRPAIVLLLIALASCDRSVQLIQKSPEPETYVADPDSLGFDLTQILPDREFVATYTAHDKTARFRIQLDPPSPTAKNFAVGKGRFLPEPGSDSGAILTDLAKVLEAKKIPERVTRAPSVSFEYVILGENMSKGKNGFGDPPGHWSMVKLFFGNDDAELFLNLNPVIRKGEFSIKDPDYGDYLIAELAKIL